MILLSEPDWSREKPRGFWDPSRQLLGAIRRYQRCKVKSGFLALIKAKLAVFQYRFWSVIAGTEIPITSKIGGELLILHHNGILIHPASVIFGNYLIHQQVTIGVKRYSTQPPMIGNHVDIGAGAKIIGPVKVGDEVLIGANSVVVKDVSAGVIVAGIPAKVIGNTRQDN